MARFNKVLVANRGEIAVRVIQGAQKAGYQTVAVYSDADADAQHVQLANQAVHIGPAPAKDSYLLIERIIAAAKQTGAEAIHPGYGFLSERADFSQAVADAGLIFIGPDAHSIEKMGNKSASKIRMIAASVPCVPGYQGDDQSDETLVAEAVKAGLPVMIKAAAGGGGRGMRLVYEADQLLSAVQSARSEASNAFGSGQLLIEKAVLNARHVEIQVFGDRHGNVIHLGERDCSVQRRNQKVVEEAPSPAVSPELRARMGAAAVAAAQAVDYVGAGTVEFMLAADGAFYFLEMNTRLQVEHPVTELVYGVDLVDWQLRIAQGERLPMQQAELLARQSGHAIEVRLCAEDPLQNYLPQTGDVLSWKIPTGEGVRVDSYLQNGQAISPFYDSMQAKIIVWGSDRAQACQRLRTALANTTLLGVVHNKAFLSDIITHPAFVSGEFNTGFIGSYFPQEQLTAMEPSAMHQALAAMAVYLSDATALADQHQLSPEFIGWHSSHASATTVLLGWGNRKISCELNFHQPQFLVKIGEQTLEIALRGFTSDRLAYAHNGVLCKAKLARTKAGIWLETDGQTWYFADLTLMASAGKAAGSDGRLLAHSDGKVVAVHVAVGDTVSKGQTLAVLEAMKMEFQLSLPVSGVVESVSVSAGQQVKNRTVLVTVRAD